MLSRHASMPRRGVSLIEVAVTLAMAAILMFAVLPDVTSMMANNRIRGTAEAYLQGLQRARTEALRTNQVVTFWLASANGAGVLDNTCALSSSARGWVVSRDDPSGSCASAVDPRNAPFIVDKATGASTAGSVAITALQADATAATSVAFDGFGRVTTATAIATIDLDNVTAGNNFRPLRIQVARGGGLRLCEPRVSDATDPRRC